MANDIGDPLRIRDVHILVPAAGEHGDSLRGTKPTVRFGETIQRAIRHVDAQAAQQLVHLREAQSAPLSRRRLKPRADLGCMRREGDVAGASRGRGRCSIAAASASLGFSPLGSQSTATAARADRR
jgi:hypothetical protein